MTLTSLEDCAFLPQKIFVLFLSVLLLALSGTASADRLKPDDVPESLKPWVGWVLHDNKDRDCTYYYNQNNHQCAWPSKLALNLSKNRGEFSQTWHIEAETTIPLPGGQNQWPQGVTVDDKPATVITRSGRPVIKLQPGAHVISGTFAWKKLPESLVIPEATAIVNLSINGRTIKFPDLNANGQLWLRQRDDNSDLMLEDRFEYEVFRKVNDDNPLSVTTHFEIEVSGAKKEVALEHSLLSGFIPRSLSSRLPARIEPNGQIRLQVRPGKWTVELVSHLNKNIVELSLPESNTPNRKPEIWVFDSNNALRLVEISGIDVVDPRQTRLPSHWQQLPAYRVNHGDTMRFKVIRRGNPEPEPNKLSMERKLWLDFDGSGYTIQDSITGTMTKGWRLEAASELKLGRVAIDNTPQFITQAAGSDKQGVEVRRGAINLVADSRYLGDRDNIPAVAWDNDFHSLSATLHLPPGWTLFSASGPDNVPNTWLQRWTLLDLFLVLIASLAIYRLWGAQWGVLALLTLTLIWHEPGAPKIVFLNILAAVALLRVMPENRFSRMVQMYKYAGLFTLVVLAIPFMVDQIRVGLYPQLAQQNQSMSHTPGLAPVMISERTADEAVEFAESASPRMLREKMARVTKPVDRRRFQSDSYLTQQYDPNAFVQTGPGVPSWQWNSVPLRWNGPVSKDQDIDLTLISPAMNLMLNILRVGLLVILGLVMLDVPNILNKFKIRNSASVQVTSSVMIIGLLGLLTFSTIPSNVSAQENSDFPDQSLLKELKARLLAPPKCLPECAQVPRIHIDVDSSQISIRSEIHVSENVAVPLPVNMNRWMPEQVLVDGELSDRLLRDKSGLLWIGLDKGVHQVITVGALPKRHQLQIPLPLQAHRVTYEIEGWILEGVHEDGRVDRQLQLTRIKQQSAEQAIELEPTALPPFLNVERVIRLGVDWYIETKVSRVSPAGSGIVVKIPLLEGESVVTDGVNTEDSNVIINMGPMKSVVQWRSILNKSDLLTLVANNNSTWSEVWRLDVSPIWHATIDGIPVVHHQDSNHRWLPEWRPWPDESVTIKLEKPKGVEGNTLTIDRSALTVSPGTRASDATLELSIRSSQGTQHTITLPEGAVLQSVTIDGKTQPIRQGGDSVTLPIHPGHQNVALTWRISDGISTYFATPDVDLGNISVNNFTNVKLGSDRWILFVGGPQMGPAVLFWGVLVVIIIVSVGLGRTKSTPLKTWQWVLLGIGLSQVSIYMALLVVGWFFAIAWRRNIDVEKNKRWFNTAQALLGVFTLFALLSLFVAVEQGLLGSPDMQVKGNQSYATDLKWFADRSDSTLDQAWVITSPLYIYRVIMLAWALWLAFSLLGWLKWAWGCYSANSIWLPSEPKPKKAKKKDKWLSSPAKETPMKETPNDKD